MLFETISLGFAVFCFVCLYSSRGKRSIVKIPGPKGWPIVGNAYHYALPPEQLFSFLRLLYKTYGGINSIYAINMQAVNIYDPDDIETILSNTRFNGKKQPYTFLKHWLSEGLLVSNGEKWHQRRKLLTRAFHFNILKKFMVTFTERAEVFVSEICSTQGKRIDIFPVVAKTTLDVICETTMGSSDTKGARSFTDKYFEAVHNFGQVLTKRMCRTWLYFDLIFRFSDLYKTQKQLVKTLHEFTVSIINRKKEEKQYEGINAIPDECDVYGSKGNLAMLDLLLENEKGGVIDLDGIREEVDTFMFEGHDTVAMAVSFFIMRMANEQYIQDKIYEEMQGIFGNSSRTASFEDINEMKYLDCCIKESLRIYPSVPFISRYLTKEVTLSGYRVPPGTNCQIHIFDLHHNEKLYPRPEEFIPERFLPQNSSQRHPYAYIPFSAGPRNCIGQKFAMLEMKTLTSALLRKFRVVPITRPEELVFRGDIVLRTNHPVYVRFCPRE